MVDPSPPLTAIADPIDDIRRDASPLGEAATGERLRALHRAGVLDEAGLGAALAVAAGGPDAGGWRALLDRLLLGSGAGLVVAGVIFFFAANWDALHRFGKLGSVAALLVAAAGWALYRPAMASGRVALTAAAGLVGALLAVYGQVYQTGADAWQLFAAWAVLIGPWVVAARFEPMVVLWLVVAELAVGLWWDQVGPRRLDSWLWVALAAAPAAAWLVAERLAAARWFVRGAFLAMVAPLTAVVLLRVFAEGSYDDVGQGVLVAVPALVAAAVYVLRRPGERVDLVMATGLAAAALTVVACGAGRLLFGEMDAREGGVLLMAALVVGEVALAALWLRGLWQRGAR
ncbi:MAG: DUF2157 domain-containing protein [Myxococcales bacterium]|nr:DUF2157 domain-containing protein [Myxococcales bacterium]